MRVDRWFLTRFSIDNAYGGLCEEFISLEGGPSAWEQQTGRGNPFIATPFGGNANRQLKINAQRIGPLFHGQYLASEGPTVSSVFDFWCMVWQVSATMCCTSRRYSHQICRFRRTLSVSYQWTSHMKNASILQCMIPRKKQFSTGPLKLERQLSICHLKSRASTHEWWSEAWCFYFISKKLSICIRRWRWWR